MDDMSQKTNNDSCISTTGTPVSQSYSGNIDNVNYINLNFVDNSESSSQAKGILVEHQKLHNFSQEHPKVNKPLPNKILPSNLPLNGLDKYPQKSEHQLVEIQEKSLFEMGYKANEVQGWENIVQPPKEDLYKLLKNMIDNHIKPNVQIRIGEVNFNCHLMVLQCYSDFFMECNNEILIKLPEEKITPTAFVMVYDWMLSSEPLVQRECILELFCAANFLRIKELINQCWICLDDDVRFCENTAFLLYLEARQYGLESLEQLMLMRICKFFLTLVASKEFLTLNHREICTLLSSNTIGVNSEIEIFMSVVRWLSYNWTERQRHMLDVVKCVRFSLMPPWFLVTLNKNTDCLEIDRIIEHPEVKKMINDGITYTTTQLYYGENREEFLHFLERYQLTAPMQRQWVFDKECNYHHRLECPNMQCVTYKSFLEYLEMIRTIGKEYWRSLEMDKGVEKSMHCFMCTDCRKSTEPNLVTIYAKKSRDQGIQCVNKMKYRKGKEFHKKKFTQRSIHRIPRERSNYVLPSQTMCSTNNYDITKESETTVDTKYPIVTDANQNLHMMPKQGDEEERPHQQETILYDDDNHRQHHHQQQYQTDIKKQQQQHIKDSLSTTMLHIFSNPIDNNIANKREQQQHLQQLSKPYLIKQMEQKEQQQRKNFKHNKTHKDTGCTAIYNKCSGGLKVDVSDDCIKARQQQQYQRQTQCINNDNHIAELMKHNTDDLVLEKSTDCNAENNLIKIETAEKNIITDVTRISNYKILVFGGIDPYCFHRKHMQQYKKRQQLKQQHRQQQLQHRRQHYYHQQQLLQRKPIFSINSSIMNKTTQLHPSRNHPYIQTNVDTCADTYEHIRFHTITNADTNKSFESCGDHVLFYDIDAIEWQHLSHIPFGSRHNHAVVLCNGLIYVIGGTRTAMGCIKKSVFEKTVWCFNPQTLKWTLETNLPESRRDFAVIAIDEKIVANEIELKHDMGFYVIGGEGVNGNALSTVWFYNIKRKIWIKKPSLNMGRYGLASAIVNNEIWVAGGIINGKTVDICGKTDNGETFKSTTAHVITDTIEVYSLKYTHDILDNNHEKELSETRYEVGGGDVDVDNNNNGLNKNWYNAGKIRDANNSDCNVEQWTKSKLHLRIPRLFGKFCKISNYNLYLVGGIGLSDNHHEITSLNDIDVYNVEQQKWDHIGDLNLARHGHDVATLNDHCIVAIGGVSTLKKCALNNVEAFCTKTLKSLKNLPDLPWSVSGCAVVTMK